MMHRGGMCARWLTVLLFLVSVLSSTAGIPSIATDVQLVSGTENLRKVLENGGTAFEAEKQDSQSTLQHQFIKTDGQEEVQVTVQRSLTAESESTQAQSGKQSTSQITASQTNAKSQTKSEGTQQDEDGKGDKAKAAVANSEDGKSQKTDDTATSKKKKGGNKEKPPTPKKVRIPPKSIKILPMAPAANVSNDGDIDPEGACEANINKYCKSVELGEGRVASCLSNIIAEQELDGTKEKRVSDACRSAVYDFKVQINRNANANVALAKACKEDALKWCNGTASLFSFKYKEGAVLTCLKDIKQELSKKCKTEVFKIQQDAAMDFRADPDLFAACGNDAKRLCPDVEYGGGRVQECLRNQPVANITWDCREKLFWQEVESSDDIRLSVRLFAKCLQDKKKFCPDVAPGHAVVKDCLEDHRSEPGFSEGCKTELEKMIERRARDFRLDSKLRNTCAEDMSSLCSMAQEYLDDDTEGGDASQESLVNCLQDYSQEIRNPECARLVAKYQRLAAEDIRFASNLADACYSDRTKFCTNVPPGSARVIRCLKRHRSQLDKVCSAQLFDEEVRFSNNIDFQYPMKTACKKEMKKFCKQIPHGNARVIRCLQDKKSEKGFGDECRAEVKKYEHESAQDYRFNHRLSEACKKEVTDLCKGLCAHEKGELCGGRVLHCLIDKKDQITTEACSNEIQYFEKMQVSDFRNDLILAQACREDVEKHCKDANPDEEPGAVHKCLREKYQDLSEACRAEEMKVEQIENENIELSPNLLKACKDEREMFCGGVAPGSGRVFKCLADKMGDADFGIRCHNAIRNKLQRRQANWRLDPPLRKQCKTSVAKLCSDIDTGMRSQPGAVVKCLVDNMAEVEPGCQKELGRAVHMAFFTWQKQGVLTEVCDEDIQRLCLAKRPSMDSTPGAVASCLADVLEDQASALNLRRLMARPDPEDDADDKLSEECMKLADIAIPQNYKKQFDDSLAFALIASQLEKLEGKTGVSMLTRNQAGEAQDIKLTGWTALAGVTALLLVVMYGAATLYRRYRGIPDSSDYTVVLKGKASRGSTPRAR